MRILIVKLGSIGDIVHTLPSLAAVRAALPDAEISWVVEERSAEILRGNPLIDNLIEADTRSLRNPKNIERVFAEAGKQVSELRSFTFDVAIDLQGLIKSGLIARLSGAKVRFGFSRAGLRERAARFFYTDQIDVPAGIHIIRKNLALTGGALGIEVPDSDLEFPIGTERTHVEEAESIIDAAGSKDIAILNPAGGWVTKLWPAENFGDLADLLWQGYGLRSVIVTGPGEDELAKKVADSSRSAALTLAQPSLKGFYELARRARLYVGGDTGPTHLAVAAKAPIVGLFGPTEWWRNGSPDPDDICIERTDIDCRIDCHRRTCSKWICMDTDVETVFNAVRKRLLNNFVPAGGPIASNILR